MWGGQSWPQPPFQAAAGRMPAPQDPSWLSLYYVRLNSRFGDSRLTKTAHRRGALWAGPVINASVINATVAEARQYPSGFLACNKIPLRVLQKDYDNIQATLGRGHSAGSGGCLERAVPAGARESDRDGIGSSFGGSRGF